MYELIDKSLMSLIEQMRNEIFKLCEVFVGDAKALACLFVLLYFAVESYKMMVGDKKLEIIPLLRPFAIGLVLLFWADFVKLIDAPVQIFTEQGKNMFQDQLGEVENLSRMRYALSDSVAMVLLTRSVEVVRAEDETKEKKWYQFGIDFSIISDRIAGLWIIVTGKIKSLLFTIIEYIVVTIWQVAVYIVFFLQLFFIGILIILGPLSFAFSVLPAFKDAWLEWLARYISVSLYACIAYIALTLSLAVMRYGLETEIDIMNQALNNEVAFLMFTTMSSGCVNLFIITCLMGLISMLTIPFVSTWIINTTGVASAIGGIVAGTMGVAKTAGKAATGGLA